MLRREDVEAPRRSSRHSDDPTPSSQRSVGTVPRNQGEAGPSRRSADIPIEKLTIRPATAAGTALNTLSLHDALPIYQNILCFSDNHS